MNTTSVHATHLASFLTPPSASMSSPSSPLLLQNWHLLMLSKTLLTKAGTSKVYLLGRWHILLKIPENVEPLGSGEDVLVGADLEVVVGGHGVVDPPQPAGHKVGKKNINTIVTPRRHQGADAHQTDQEGNPMKKNISP